MIAQLSGYQVGFDDSGDGLPVVFLHGFPHDRTLWTAQRLSLAPPVRCIVPALLYDLDLSIPGTPCSPS